MAPAVSPPTVNDSPVPESAGAVSPNTSWAELKFDESIGEEL